MPIENFFGLDLTCSNQIIRKGTPHVDVSGGSTAKLGEATFPSKFSLTEFSQLCAQLDPTRRPLCRPKLGHHAPHCLHDVLELLVTPHKAINELVICGFGLH